MLIYVNFMKFMLILFLILFSSLHFRSLKIMYSFLCQEVYKLEEHEIKWY